MVGVPKSSGCKTCKKRRLKCDESWPECLRCQKIKQPCPGTTILLTFKDGRPKIIGGNAPLAADESTTKVDFTLRSETPVRNLQTDLTILDSKFSKSGALSQKWRINRRQEPPGPPETPTSQQDLDLPLGFFKEGPLGFEENYGRLNIVPTPTPSTQDKLARALVSTFEVPDSGYRLTAFGKYMRDLPKYVGESPALDAAAACLVDAHFNMMRNHHSCGNQVADPVLYLKALQRLQEALQDGATGMSVFTLAATTLLGIIETLGGFREESKYLSHAGGTTKLIEVRGPNNHLDGFANDVLRSQLGKIIVQSLWCGTGCFLESEEWQAVAFLDQPLTETDLILNKIIKHLIFIPRILKDYRELRSSSSSSPPLCLLFRLREMRSSLIELGRELESRLYDEAIATMVPSRFGSKLVPVCWDFKEWQEIQVYSNFWGLVIVVNQMLGELTGTHDHEFTCKEAAYNICKLYECSWASRPFGSLFMVLSFSVAYLWVDHDLKGWIVEALNELGNANSTGSWWCPQAVEYFAELMTGERLPVIP